MSPITQLRSSIIFVFASSQCWSRHFVCGGCFTAAPSLNKQHNKTDGRALSGSHFNYRPQPSRPPSPIAFLLKVFGFHPFRSRGLWQWRNVLFVWCFEILFSHNESVSVSVYDLRHQGSVLETDNYTKCGNIVVSCYYHSKINQKWY